MYPIHIFDKGGKSIFRKYNEDTLRTIYSASKLGANYEVFVLVEGLIFMAILSYYTLRGEVQEYFDFLFQEPMPGLGAGINKLKKLQILEDLLEEIEAYKKARNAFAHDPFRLKAMVFTDYHVSEECERLFEQGMLLLNKLSPLVQPGFPTMDEYKRRFKGTIPGNNFEIKPTQALQQVLEKRRRAYLEIPNAKNKRNLEIIVSALEKETS